VHVPHRSWNLFKVYYLWCVGEFLCILFSRIFSMCLRLLGASPTDPLRSQTSTKALPCMACSPLGDPRTSVPRPPLSPPLANSWVRPCQGQCFWLQGQGQGHSLFFLRKCERKLPARLADDNEAERSERYYRRTECCAVHGGMLQTSALSLAVLPCGTFDINGVNISL